MEINRQVNAIGDACPLPVVKAKKALAEMETGTLEVLVDNDIAVQNLQRLAASGGCGFASEQQGEKQYCVHITKTAASTVAQAVVPTCGPSGDTVVVISSRCMGSGDDELGAQLMKNFLFSLTQMDNLPQTILFYNGGVFLTTEGSSALDDLRALEKAGVEIFSCGACLNHYGLGDKVAVGGVTNMYSIAEKQLQAGRIVRP